jgi:hypothetical protein
MSRDMRRLLQGLAVLAGVAGVVALLALVTLRAGPPEYLRNEGHALGVLRAVSTAQLLSRERTGRSSDLAALAAAGWVRGELADGVEHGYRFEVRPSARTPELLWFAVANPVEPGETGLRSFCTNQEGALFYTTASATSIDEGGVECGIPRRVLPVRR